jgi:hypothetical protein
MSKIHIVAEIYNTVIRAMLFNDLYHTMPQLHLCGGGVGVNYPCVCGLVCICMRWLEEWKSHRFDTKIWGEVHLVTRYRFIWKQTHSQTQRVKAIYSMVWNSLPCIVAIRRMVCNNLLQASTRMATLQYGTKKLLQRVALRATVCNKL